MRMLICLVVLITLESYAVNLRVLSYVFNLRVKRPLFSSESKKKGVSR